VFRLARIALIAAPLLLTGPALAEAQAAGHRVKVNGMQMYYEVSGPRTGAPLIVLHGAYMNIPSMGAIIPRLAKTYRVYALEFQGHGRTTDIDRPITYPNLADDVAAFIDAVGLRQADVFGYSMGAIAGLQLAIRHPQKVNKLIAASVAYDVRGWQPVFTAFIPQMTVEMIVAMPFAAEYRKLAPNPDGFPELARKLIALEKEPMAWEADVRALKTPVLIISGDADVATLEHSVAMFRLLGGGIMGDMGKPLPASRLAVLPATSHTAVITQPDLLLAYIEPFLKGVTPKGFFEDPAKP
jgi:pimeloyl-ACP methyl ester carboxylesterase